MLRRILPFYGTVLFLAATPSPVQAGSAARRVAGAQTQGRANRRPSRTDLRRARRLFKKASRAYSAGKYAKAASLFIEIHGIVGDPALLFNAADAFEKAAMFDQALANYQAYLAAKPNAPDRRDVEAKIAQIQKSRTLRARQPPVTPRPPRKVPGARTGSPHPRAGAAGTSSRLPGTGTSASPATTTPGTQAETKAAGARAARKVAGEAPEQTAPTPPPTKHRSPLTTAGWALVGTTAILLTAMGIMALKMEDAEDQMRRLAIMVDPSTETRLQYAGSYQSDFERYERQGRLYEKLTWGFAAAAGAAAVTAVVLFSVRAAAAKREHQKVSISPVLGKGRGGLVIETRF